jgi:hypothetical protein
MGRARVLWATPAQFQGGRFSYSPSPKSATAPQLSSNTHQTMSVNTMKHKALLAFVRACPTSKELFPKCFLPVQNQFNRVFSRCSELFGETMSTRP